MSKKSSGARQKLGEKREKRWARNFELAKYLNVSEMTLWRWQHEPKYNFPLPAQIDSMKFTDLDAVDEWMEARIRAQEGEP